MRLILAAIFAGLASAAVAEQDVDQVAEAFSNEFLAGNLFASEAECRARLFVDFHRELIRVTS